MRNKVPQITMFHSALKKKVAAGRPSQAFRVEAKILIRS